MKRLTLQFAFLLLATTSVGQAKTPKALQVGKDSVGESIAIFAAHDAECFNESHLQIGSVGNLAVAGCDIETRKGETITLAGIPVTKRHAIMDKDRIVSLGYEFKHRDYPRMRATLVNQLGQPKGAKVGTSADGCVGEQVAWTNDVSVVNLQECVAKGESSIAVFGLREFITRTGTAEPESSAQ